MSLAFTSAGTIISISAILPATFNDNISTGYPSLTFTEIGEVTDIPEFGKAFTLVTHNPLGNRQTVKRKGSYDNGSVTLQMARVPSDAGQALCQDALESDNSYAFEVVLQDGTIQYFTAQTLSYTTNVGSVNQITGAAVQIELDRDIVEVAPGS